MMARAVHEAEERAVARAVRIVFPVPFLALTLDPVAPPVEISRTTESAGKPHVSPCLRRGSRRLRALSARMPTAIRAAIPRAAEARPLARLKSSCLP